MEKYWEVEMKKLFAGVLVLAFFCLQIASATGFEDKSSFEELLKHRLPEKPEIPVEMEKYVKGSEIKRLLEKMQESRELKGKTSALEVKEKVTLRLVTGHEILAGIMADGSVRVLSALKDIDVSEKYAIPRGLDLQKVDKNIFNVEYLVKEGYAAMQEYPLIVVFKPEKRGEAAKAIGKTKIVREFSIIPAYAVRISLGDEFYKLLESDAVEKIWLDYKGHS